MKVFRCCRLRMSPWWNDCCLPNSKHAIPDDEYACGNLTILEHCVWSRGMATHAFHQIIKISRNMTDPRPERFPPIDKEMARQS